MLEFIVGRAGTGKTHACLEAMKKSMEKNPLGPALILLVPEHMTYRMERELAVSIKKGSGFLRAYVLGFRRFARQILLETGGGSRPRITEVGRRLLLRRIIGKRHEELTFFARAAKQRGFGESLSEMIQELKSYRISPETLKNTAKNIPNPQLSEKISELALLSADFAAAMEGRETDAEDMMDALAQRIPYSKLLEGANVYVDGFVFFNPQEKAVLRALIEKVKDVHITLTMDTSKGSWENHNQAGLFHRSYETFSMLWNMSKELKITPKIHKTETFHRFHKPALQILEQQLLRLSPRPANEGDGVHIVEAANQRIEVEAMAAEILRLCREENYRCRDIGILVRDREAYGGLLPLVLEDHDIPFFEDHKRPAMHHPLAELMRSALDMLHGWRYEALFRCLRTGFFPIPWAQIDQLENYVLEFGIRGESRWAMEKPWKWHRRSVDEDSDEIPEKLEEKLAEIDLVRRQAVSALLPFAAEVKKARTVREITLALYHLLEQLNAAERLKEWAKQSEDRGMLAMAKEHGQIWEDVIELLEQLSTVSGDEEISLRDFEAVLGDGLDALEMSLIPPGLDYVTIAPFDQNSLANARAIFILGANEGIMPQRAAEKGLLSDGERLRLKEAGLEISSGGQENIFAEKHLLYRGFTESSEYLWVSYALSDPEGTGLSPSPLLQRMRIFLDKAEFISLPLESIDSETEEFSRQEVLRLSDGKRAASGLAGALRRKKEGRSIPSWWLDVYNWLLKENKLDASGSLALEGLFAHASEGSLPKELAAQLFAKNRRLGGSVTRFERFRSCPFQHFAQYGLRLQERRERKFQSLDLGNLLHGLLREFGSRLKSQGRRWSEIDEQEASGLLSEILEELAPRLQNELLLSTRQYRHQLNRIRLLAERSIRRLRAFDAVSEFHPQVFERAFGRGPGSMPPLSYELDGFRMEIAGQIDRMDFDDSGKYFMILDYKTGQAYINLLEVYYGLKMQLLTYLLVARNLLRKTEEQELLPAGMLYCFLRWPMCSADRKITIDEAKKKIENGLKMPGWVLADPDVVKAIDSTQQFIKVKLNRDGSIGKASRASVRSLEEFDTLLAYIDYLLEDTGRKILSGDIEARPYRMQDGKMPCRYCVYQSLCGFDPALDGYGWQNFPKLDDDEIMAAMKEQLEQRKNKV
ncbi:MAG: helicase-exonuclease AddAB subunit AddB [Selenomonadaceae bacterium]|nr:helicase-exonuclease AddAB subunit AddB [Selenomonadaceae bacterium]